MGVFVGSSPLSEAEQGARVLKILHCIPSLQSGGAERQLSILAVAQARQGIDVHVAYLHRGPHLAGLREGNVALHQLDVRGNHDPRILSRMWLLLRDLNPDIVHSWIPQMDIVTGLVSRARGIPWVMSERSSAPAYEGRFKDRVLRASIGRGANAVIANSVAGAELWSDRLGGGAQAYVVRNALPIESIDATPVASLREFGIPDNVPTLIFAGRLSYEKNVSLLITVAESVCRRSDAVFLICGDGPLRVAVEESLIHSSYRSRIKTLGYRPDVWGLMKAADAFVSTSFFEGHPNAVLEAMACHCPLIVSDIAAHREFLTSEMGEIVPLEESAFVAAIMRVLEGGELVTDREARARHEVEQLDARNIAAAYNSIYSTLIGSPVTCAA